MLDLLLFLCQCLRVWKCTLLRPVGLTRFFHVVLLIVQRWHILVIGWLFSHLHWFICEELTSFIFLKWNSLTRSAHRFVVILNSCRWHNMRFESCLVQTSAALPRNTIFYKDIRTVRFSIWSAACRSRFYTSFYRLKRGSTLCAFGSCLSSGLLLRSSATTFW